MNKNEYLEQLRKELVSVPSGEVQEIVDEIEAHFFMATEAGKTEEQVVDELGDVHELAKAYTNCTSNEIPETLNSKDDKPVGKGPKVFVILLNIFVAAPLAIVWIMATLSIGFKVTGTLIGLVVRFSMMGMLGKYLYLGLLFQAGAIFSIIAMAIMIYFSIFGMNAVANKYFSWNRKVWRKGF